MARRDPLSRALRKLRTVEPSEHALVRVDRALRDAERREHAGARRARPSSSAVTRNLVLVIPALASMAVALHLVVAEPRFDAAHTAEHALELPMDGEGALSLDLGLEAHAAPFASVRMHVPRGVQIAGSDSRLLAPESCQSNGCIYEFMQSTSEYAAPMQMRVREPGRYRVHVEHASDLRRIEEVLVVHAHR
ncbi:MAG: hypothetical protein RL385_5081 [Pseudomonadota bacterium]